MGKKKGGGAKPKRAYSPCSWPNLFRRARNSTCERSHLCLCSQCPTEDDWEKDMSGLVAEALSPAQLAAEAKAKEEAAAAEAAAAAAGDYLGDYLASWCASLQILHHSTWLFHEPCSSLPAVEFVAATSVVPLIQHDLPRGA